MCLEGDISNRAVLAGNGQLLGRMSSTLVLANECVLASKVRIVMLAFLFVYPWLPLGSCSIFRRDSILSFSMPERKLLRRRKPSPSVGPPARTAEDTSPTALPAKSASFSWRFYIRWIARFAIPVVLLLGNARVVMIPSRPNLPLSHTTALLVITHSRHSYLSVCLESILRAHPRNNGWPVIVSMDRQDGEEHAEVAGVVRNASVTAGLIDVELYPWSHEMSYENDVQQGEGFVDNIAYRRISRHYEWALTRAFQQGLPGRPPIERVVVVEDDMKVALDFFSYFDTLTPMLENDPTLFCVSAWNDNGIESLALNVTQLHRTDFFPGLGWMLTRSLWEELAPKWPKMFWDDWMRSMDQTKGRQCIRPEVSRTQNFGEKGVSQSFHFKKHVSQVVLAKETVNFSDIDLSYLEPERYHDYIFSRMSNAVQLKYSNYLTSRPQDRDVIAFYPDGHLEAIGKRTGVMVDHRNGIRRTSYKGVIVFAWNGHWAFVVQRGWEPPGGYRLGNGVCC